MALFVELAQLAEQLAAEPGRLKNRAAIVVVIARIAAISTEDAGRLCLYLAGQTFAEADPRKLSAGGALLTSAVKKITGCTDAALSAAYRRHGDLGAAAFDLWPANISQPSLSQPAEATLTFTEVATAFAAMAAARTTAARAALVEGLLRRATAIEAKYLLKLMLGDMRIGVKQSLIEEAIAVAAEAEVVAVRNAVMLEADLQRTVTMAFAGTLAQARMSLFHPLGFMLASPVETPEEAIARFTGKAKAEEPANAVEPTEPAEAVEPTELAETPVVHAFLEDKYDGMRAQIHCGDLAQPGRVAIYSRNREEITEGFPEIVEAFRGVVEPGGGLVLDGELLGWDFATAKALPFSVLGQRIGRKRVDNEIRRRIPVVFMAFDLLFEGEGEGKDESLGESAERGTGGSSGLLLPLPLRERRNRLEAVVERLQSVTVAPLERDEAADSAQAGLFAAFEPASPALPRLMLSPSRLVETAEQIDRAYADARARANEGVMLKAAESAYQPGRRGLAWVKLKRELATLDVVITGAEFGHGRRAGLLSDYTFAVKDTDGELRNVGKAYSGVTDAEIAELTEWLKAHTLEDHGHFRTVEPLRVLEVAFNNVMRSDRHASGFALRFPRILRIRDDKPVEEIDTLDRVLEIYNSQPDKGVET